MGDRIGVVKAYGGFVACDGGRHVAALQELIAEVDERSRTARIACQRRLEVGPRSVRATARRAHDTAFVEREGALGGRRGDRRQCCKAGLGLVVLAAGQCPLGGFARGRRGSESPQESKHRARMFTIDLVTLFPEVFAPFVGLSIVGRAVEAKIVEVRYHHLLDALEGAERADDAPFGGGPGMVLRLAPIARVLDRLIAQAPAGERRAIVVTSAAGVPFRQADAQRYAGLDRLVLVCGHYEGIDERLAELYPIEERSLGDFVLTGGEIPALAFIDATVRLLDGVLEPESLRCESFADGGLDYPSYTRPPVFRGVEVPPVLLSGDHAAIARWRREQSRARTVARRADLLEGREPPRAD